MIAVTGATGQLGPLVIDALLKSVPAGEIVAIARNADKAAAIAAKGVTVRIADYDKPETWTAALAGIDTLAFISASEFGQRARQHRTVVDAAKAAGVKLIAYTSILHADTSGITLAAEHRDTEAALRASGIPTIILRNGWYTENYTGNLTTALAHGVAGAAGTGRISAATRQDFAEAIAAAVTGRAEAGRIYELAGDSSFTLGELAAEVAGQSGKPVAYNHMGEGDYAAMLASVGLPGPLAQAIASWDTEIAKGALHNESGDLARLIGRPTTPLSKAVAASLAR